MRDSYRRQLEILHTELIRMGALCEDAIDCAAKGLLNEDVSLRDKAHHVEAEIDIKEREIEAVCGKLLLREQPVAGDLRQITTAQKIITDMERIGDMAADIADISAFMEGSPVKSDVHIGDMARAAIKMLSDSVDSFVAGDLEKAKTVIRYDDVVDGLFSKVKSELIAHIIAGGVPHDTGAAAGASTFVGAAISASESTSADASTAAASASASASTAAAGAPTAAASTAAAAVGALSPERHATACLDLLMIAKYLERIGDHAENIAESVVYSITGMREH
ncbi:MAG: hypothetical protein LBU58_04360 [Clostridiales bacterium]|jgi:phosphate transport system protein|nr:hypothetical protein [Clostridiales bacterium]